MRTGRVYLAELIRASRVELARLQRGLPVRLTNFAVALKQLHRGACSPYPCGAGGGYFSVSAEGRWYACHRADRRPGVRDGIEPSASIPIAGAASWRTATCTRRPTAEPAGRATSAPAGATRRRRSRTAASCDFVRGWLEFCLAAYCELGGPLPGGDLR